MTEERRIVDVIAVDDEQVVLDSIRKILVEGGITVDCAIDSDQGRSLLKSSDYRMMLLDIMLPHESGFDLLGEFCRGVPALPVVMMTGYATFEQVLRSLAKGAFDFVPKPFSFEDLPGVIHRALRYQEAMKDESRRRELLERLSSITLDRCHCLGSQGWARSDSEGAYALGLGLGFLAADLNVSSIEIPEPGDDVKQGAEYARILTTDGVLHRVWAPLSGKVVIANDALRKNPGSLAGLSAVDIWLVEIAADSPEREIAALKPCGCGN